MAMMPLSLRTPVVVQARLISCVVFFAAALPAQMLMQGSGPAGAVRIFNSDSAILESQEPRKDLPCTVTPIKADLGFDLKFHAGYEVSIPLKDLAGSENALTMIFRVTPRPARRPGLLLAARFRAGH